MVWAFTADKNRIQKSNTYYFIWFFQYTSSDGGNATVTCEGGARGIVNADFRNSNDQVCAA